jgi:hypothetical protein
MLDWLKKYLPAIVLSLALLLIVDATISSLATCHPPDNSNGSQSSCTIFQGPFISLIIWLGNFFDTHDKGIVAAFTAILAISTIGLWLSTQQLWKITDKMLRQAEKSDVILERAYLWPGYGLLIIDQVGLRFGIHLGIRNTGRTAGIIKTVHHALLPKEEFEASKTITYYVFNGREDAIIPDPNAEVRSGVWHRLSEMPKVSCGWITYIDVFGTTRRRGYKYIIDHRGRTDSLPDCFTYEPWNTEYKEKPSEQEPLPQGFTTTPIKSGETA